MALKELLTDLSKFKYTNYENVGANNSQIKGRHGGFKGSGQPPHPEEHSKFDDKVGKFRKPQYAGVTSGNEIPFPGNYDPNVGGIHGGIAGPTPAQPPHSDRHSLHDNGVGHGIYPSDHPQSFNVRGYTITGNKRFYIGWQGDIMNHPLSDYGIGAFDSIAGVFDHTQTRDKLRKVYSNYPEITFGADIDGGINGLNGSIHIGNQDLPEVVGGGLSYYGNLNSITPRGSIYRAGDGTYRVPQSGHTTIPPGVTTQYPSNIPTFDGTQITLNIPQITLTGPFGDEDYQNVLNITPKVANAHGSDFMVTPLGGTNFLLPSHIHYTLTHNVDMITLSGPTSQTYQTTLNTIPIASGAHGSDFQTTPIEAYSSIFATQDGLLMDTIYESGFNRGDMYIANQTEQSIPEFKEFSRTDTSLKRISLSSPNFDSDGNKEFGFKDRAPYNIPARDNTVFGFDQPFILKDIGDKWGPGGLGAVDEGLFRGGFVTSAARTVADVLRIGKFILTPKGIMFGLKQAGLQLLNPRKETTIWNPLSLGSVAPMVHMDRHFGTATEGFGYESVINFGLASVGKRMNSILFTYGSAVNLPGGNIPAIAAVTATRVTGAHLVGMVPSAGGVPGTIPSIPEIDIDLSGGNITSLTVKPSNKYGPKTLLGNKEYTVSDGTPIIPARNPEAGFKSGIFGGRFAGSPFTTMFLNEDGLFPSKAVTDAVIRDGRYEEDQDTFDSPYHSDFTNKQSNFGINSDTNTPDVVTKILFVNQPFGQQPLVPIHNPLLKPDDIGTPQFTTQLIYNPLNEDYPAELQIRKEGIFHGDLYKKGSEYFPKHHILIEDSKELDISKGKTVRLATTSKAGTFPYAQQKQVYKNVNDTITIGTDKKYQLGTFGDTPVDYKTRGDRIFNDSFSGDLYNKDITYENQISSLITVSSPPGKTRLRTDTAGDPTVTIKTSHRDSDPNISRLSIEGKYSELEDIKLQDFPLINFTGDGNLGSERQSLGFVNKEITGLQGNLFGIPGKTRSGFGVLDNKKYTEIITINGIVKGTLQGKDTDGIPKVEKDLAYEHKFAPEGISDKLYADGEKFTPDFKTIKTPTNLGSTFSTKTEGFPNQTGNILDKYKTLAYGDIPTVEKPDERYSKKIVVRETKGDSKVGDTTGGSSAVVVIDPELGLIKKTAVEGGAYTTDLVDKVNMHQYGDEDNNDDFIKFKFFDLINKKYIIFRASLSGISETIAPEWSSERYIGRPDSVHVYQGVERSMSFEFMVVPTSKQELPVLWEKLNYLVGLTYPTWKKIGDAGGNRMEGPFMNLTIGDMYVNTPGFLSSLSITVDDNSPWELDEGFQLPHAISVSCEFTHIGKHPLASQGKHYDLGWLRKYDNTTDWSDGDTHLGERPTLGPTADIPNALFKTPTLQ